MPTPGTTGRRTWRRSSSSRRRSRWLRRPGRRVGLTRTDANHFNAGASSSGSQFQAAHGGNLETRPSGNAVNLEDEMIKVAANQMDFQAATTLYTKSLGLLKAAIGKR